VKGHIHRRETIDRCGRRRVRWYAAVDLPRGPDGRRRQKWHGGFATRREAELVRADVLDRLRRDTYVEQSTLTLEPWVRGSWLDMVEPQLKASTFHSYRRNLELHLLPRLGELRLGELSPVLVTRAYAEILSSGRRRGRAKGTALSATTVRYLHAILHRSLADAVLAGLLEDNPASRAKVPRHSSASAPEQRCWDAAELSRFLELTDHLPLSLAWRLAAMTGMRRGEVLGLRWRDLSDDGQRLFVRRSLVAVGSELRETTPKSGRERVVDLDAGTAALLRRRRATAVDGKSRVVISSDGTSPTPGSLSRAFQVAVALAGVLEIRFHDLRHTCATPTPP
jgi:integrase